MYDKCDDFDFEIVNFPILDGDDPRYTSYGVYISQLIRFARASSHVADLTLTTNCLPRNFLSKAIGIMSFAKPFLNFIDYTMIWYLNSKLDLNLSCTMESLKLNFMAI